MTFKGMKGESFLLGEKDSLLEFHYKSDEYK